MWIGGKAKKDGESKSKVQREGQGRKERLKKKAESTRRRQKERNRKGWIRCEQLYYIHYTQYNNENTFDKLFQKQAENFNSKAPNNCRAAANIRLHYQQNTASVTLCK